MKYAIAVLLIVVSVACDDNVVRAPKPAEKDTQFVIERQMIEAGARTMYVVRDKTNGKLIYITPGSGIAVVEDDE